MSHKNKNAVRTVVYANLSAGCFLIAFSIFSHLWLIPQYVAGADSSEYISPAFMPNIAASLMIVFGSAIALGACIALRKNTFGAQSHEDSEENEYLVFGRAEIVNVVLLCALAAGYLFLLQQIGFVISSSLLLAFLIRFCGYPNLVVTGLIAVFLPLGVEQLLWHVLDIPLPAFERHFY